MLKARLKKGWAWPTDVGDGGHLHLEVEVKCSYGRNRCPGTLGTLFVGADWDRERAAYVIDFDFFTPHDFQPDRYTKEPGEWKEAYPPSRNRGAPKPKERRGLVVEGGAVYVYLRSPADDAIWYRTRYAKRRISQGRPPKRSRDYGVGYGPELPTRVRCPACGWLNEVTEALRDEIMAGKGVPLPWVPLPD